MNTVPEDEEGVASAILRDIPIMMRLGLPEGDRLPFEWLEPAFGDDVFSPLVDRLVNAYRSASPVIQLQTRAGLLRAVDRAAIAWLGAEKTLLLVDWAYEIAFESIPAPRWIALLFHRNPVDAAETAYWIREIVERFNRWPISPYALLQQAEDMPKSDWVNLVLSTSEQDRVDVAVWLLSMLRPRQDKLRAVWDAVIEPWKRRLPNLPDPYIDWYDDIVAPLSEAEQCPELAFRDSGDSDSTRTSLLLHYVSEEWDWPDFSDALESEDHRLPA